MNKTLDYMEYLSINHAVFEHYNTKKFHFGIP